MNKSFTGNPVKSTAGFNRSLVDPDSLEHCQQNKNNKNNRRKKKKNTTTTTTKFQLIILTFFQKYEITNSTVLLVKSVMDINSVIASP